MKKSANLIPLIISAKNHEEAVEVLKSTTDALHLTTSYYHLIDLKNQLDAFQSRFNQFKVDIKSLTVPKEYSDLHNIRLELNFLHMELVDDLAFEINKTKIYWEENKTAVRAEGMLELKKNEKFQSNIKATSTSALRDVVGKANIYKEYINMSAISYGNYMEFQKLVESIKLLTDSIASESKDAMHIKHKNVH